jgi:hypothetical protein
MNAVSETLWRMRGLKDIECVMMPHSLGLEVQVLRGHDREIMWSYIAGCERDIARAAAAVRERLERSGWALIDNEGERRLLHQTSAA